jgi:hypothetical protein
MYICIWKQMAQEKEEAGERAERACELLAGMGFADTRANLRVLAACDRDAEVEELLAQVYTEREREREREIQGCGG